MRIEGEGNVFLPWTLDPANPSAPAQKGDNVRDNIEQVLVENPVPGAVYTVRVRHKGSLQDGEQAFALIATGILALSPYASFGRPSLHLKENPALPALPGDCRPFSEVAVPVVVKTGAEPMLLRWLTHDVSARYGVDYELKNSADLLLPAGVDTIVYCHLRIYDDAAIEEAERFEISLTSVPGGDRRSLLLYNGRNRKQ